jgi:hypothetical protein
MLLMTNNRKARKLLSFMVMLGLGTVMAADGPPAEPAKIEIEVAPKAVEPGGAAQVTLRIVPKDGVKINRYPKIKLTVPEVEGVVQSAEATLGNPKPPPIDNPESNYFKAPEPLELELQVDPSASSGRKKIEGHVKYFYCVAASGFCAPAKANVKIPVTVR